jgi:hypothetical protein
MRRLSANVARLAPPAGLGRGATREADQGVLCPFPLLDPLGPLQSGQRQLLAGSVLIEARPAGAVVPA